MSVISFNKQDNIKMLWDLVSDEAIFRFLTPDIQGKIYNLFLTNIQGFFEAERTKTNSLVDLNKKYILLILNHIKKTYSFQPSKIKIHNEQPIKEAITYEEIQNDRKMQFEKDFSRRQEEFESSMTVKTPPVPEFADKQTDKPIREMEKILKEMQAQRNYEVEQINRNYNTSNNADNWLKPQETSLKTEKFESKTDQSQNYSRFKFLNDLNEEKKSDNLKKVTFNNKDQVNTFVSEPEDNNNAEPDDEDVNIFSKLKKVIQEPTINDENRIDKLERNISELNAKMDKIFALLSNNRLIDR
jgi:hypothetical protein